MIQPTSSWWLESIVCESGRGHVSASIPFLFGSSSSVCPCKCRGLLCHRISQIFCRAYLDAFRKYFEGVQKDQLLDKIHWSFHLQDNLPRKDVRDWCRLESIWRCIRISSSLNGFSITFLHYCLLSQVHWIFHFWFSFHFERKLSFYFLAQLHQVKIG